MDENCCVNCSCACGACGVCSCTKKSESYLPRLLSYNPEEDKSCNFCKHYLCLINQGIWGCYKNHMEMDAKTCPDYDSSPMVIHFDLSRK